MQAAPGIPSETVVCDADASHLASGRWTFYKLLERVANPFFDSPDKFRLTAAVFAIFLFSNSLRFLLTSFGELSFAYVHSV